MDRKIGVAHTVAGHG